MRSKMGLWGWTGLLAIALSALWPHGRAHAASDPPVCRTVRLASPGWLDIDGTNAMAAEVLKALGYQPVVKTLSVPIVYHGLRSGQIDAFLLSFP